VHKQLSEGNGNGDGGFVANACPISEFIKDSSCGVAASQIGVSLDFWTESKWSLNASC